MPAFIYTARDKQGTAHTGHLEAMSEDEVVAILQNRGLLVIRVSARGNAGGASLARHKYARRMHGRVTVNDQVMLCEQLAVLIDAGVPLLRSLEVVSVQVESRSLLLALEEIRRDVEAGGSLRVAVAKHPAIFSKLWINLVATGEASGHLGESLAQLARHFESARHLQNETRTALTYPAFLVVAAIAVLTVFVYWLIPKFSAIFATMQGFELPTITKIVIAISDFGRRYFVGLLLGIAGIGYLSQRYLRTEAGRRMMDRLVLHIPMFKSLFVNVQLAEFSQGLATLLASGVPLLSTLEILEHSATNKVFGKAIGSIKHYVKEGKTMAEPLAETGIFPPMVIQMVQVGEEIGELAKMARRIAKYYEEQVETFIARMTRLFEPIAILVMGFLVLFVVASIFLPIFKLSTSGGTM